MIVFVFVVFDFDDMFVLFKGLIDFWIVDLFLVLLCLVDVVIIFGGNEMQFCIQVVVCFGDVDVVDFVCLYFLLICGIWYLCYDGVDFIFVYVYDFSVVEKWVVFMVFWEEVEWFGFWEVEFWGDIFEDCGLQIMFFVFGQCVFCEVKYDWDFMGVKCVVLCDVVVVCFFGFEVCFGGFMFIDIMQVGIDKVFGMWQFLIYMGIFFIDMLFYGDCFDEGGNDYLVFVIGVLFVVVEGWEDIVVKFEELLCML